MRKSLRTNPDYFSSEGGEHYLGLWRANSINVIPDLHIGLRVFHSLSTIIHLSNVAFSLIMILNQDENGQLVDRPDSISCYMPRFTPHEIMSQQTSVWFGWLFSCLHLSWRLITRLIKRKLKINLIPFLLWNESLIGIAQSKVQIAKAMTILGTLDVVQNILSYQVPNLLSNVDKQVELRSNRTLVARKNIQRLIHKYFFVSFMAMGFCVPPIVFFGTRAIFLRHEIIYYGCQVTYLDSLYWYRSISSYIVSGAIFIDSILALFYPPILTYLMVDDLFSYWNQVRKSISRLALVTDQHRVAQCDLNFDHYRFIRFDCPRYVKTETSDRFALELEIPVVLSRVEDFFKQLTETNKFISIFLSYVLMIWLTTNIIMTLTGLQLETSVSSLVTRFLQVCGFIVMVILSASVLKMKSSTEPSFKTLCTLLALSNSTDKARWLQTLDSYSQRKYGFTLLNSRLFTTMELFKIISYTFTVIIIVKSIQG